MAGDRRSTSGAVGEVSAASLAVMPYAYAHERTRGTTGYFSCLPPDGLDFEAALRRLEAAPLDDFLHLHLLRALAGKPDGFLRALGAASYDAGTDRFIRPVPAALLVERALLAGAPSLAAAAGCEAFPADAVTRLAPHSPAVYLRAAALPDHKAAAAWSSLCRDNICGHHPLPPLAEADAPPLFTAERLQAAAQALRKGDGLLARLRAGMAEEPCPAWRRPPPQETFLRAVDALMENGLLAGPEMRHEASLSPIALLRRWNVDVAVDNGTLRHTLRGQAAAYGRGLSLAAARASYAMEIVERASAYAHVGRRQAAGPEAPCGEILGRMRPLPLTRATLPELAARGLRALDPNRLPLEAPYRGEALHWLPARDAAGAEVLVPAQAVFLFCNLDEPAFFQACGSTGLAAGNVPDEAVVAALTEIVERDAEATVPYSRRRCFVLRSRDARIQALLDDYANCGIHVQFMDLTSELGVPAYQCFVMGRDGTVARATAANLSGPRAALAALTETPWPYSVNPSTPPQPSAPGLPGLPARFLEDLPEYGLPSPAANRRLLEAVLDALGHAPLYVDITRRDLGIPVVRALVPGLCLTAEWDRFSRPDARFLARLDLADGG